MISALALYVDTHGAIDEGSCFRCHEPLRICLPVPCSSGCCDIPLCLDCAHAAGYEIH